VEVVVVAAVAVVKGLVLVLVYVTDAVVALLKMSLSIWLDSQLTNVVFQQNNLKCNNFIHICRPNTAS